MPFKKNPVGDHQATTTPSQTKSNPSMSGSPANIPIFILMMLPSILAFIFIWFRIIYAGAILPIVYDLSWLTFAYVLIGTTTISNAPINEEAKQFSRTYLAAFGLLACVWIYTATFVAPNLVMVIYALNVSIPAILVGLAAAALKRRYGDDVILRVSWALFIAMLLHAPFWIWLYMLEGQNLQFDWNIRLPGYPAIRMYGYSVEAGLAAGLGLYYLSNSKDILLRTSLTVGAMLLWMLLFWSGGRGAFLALISSCILVTILTPQFIPKMWKFLVSTIVVGAGLSLLLPVPNGAYGLLRMLGKAGSPTEISNGRSLLWSDAYSVFLDKPIFGHGALQYRYFTTKSELTDYVQVHNIILESLISFGLVGTTALIFLLGKVWITAAFRLRRADSQSTLPVFLVATSLLIHALVSGTYFHIHSVLIIAISLGLLLNDHGKSTAASD